MKVKNVKLKLKSVLTAFVAGTFMVSSVPVLTQIDVSAADTCIIDASTQYQLIRGFGGINHPEWTGQDMTEAQRKTAFGNGDNELGLTILRVFVNPDSSQWYKALPTAQYASNTGDVTIFASPWEPPANLAESGGSNGKLHLPKSNYAAYAQHLNDFGTYMKNNGVDLYSISVQNEPDYASEWTYWSTDETTDFIANYGDKITSTRLMSPESFQYSPEGASWISNGDGGKKFYTKILNNAKAMANCDVFGTHFYGTQRAWMDFPELENCGKEIWMTEVYVPNSDANSANNYPEALEVSENIHNGLVVGNMSAYTWWYIRRSYGLMTEDGKISKRGYCMAQYSKYVRPGAVRISATEQPADDVYVSAYKNTDGTIAVVAINMSETGYAQQFSTGENITNINRYRTSASENLALTENLANENGSFFAQLPANSVSTFVIETSGSGNTQPTEPDENGYYFHDDFEESVSDWSARGENKIGLSGRTPYMGTNALLVSERTAAWNGAEKALDTSVFKPGEEYSFSACVEYVDGADTEKFSMTLQYKDANGDTKYANIDTKTAVKDNYVQLYNRNYKIPEAAVSDLKLVIETSAETMNFYIDEAIGAVAGTVIDGPAEIEPPTTTTTTTTTAVTTENNSTTTVTVTSETEATTTEPLENILWGDANCDGQINVADVTAVSAYVSNSTKNPLTAQGLINADVHTNGNSLNASDAFTIQQYVTGVIREFSIS